MKYEIYTFNDNCGENHVIRECPIGVNAWGNYHENGQVVMSRNKQELINRIDEIEKAEKIDSLDAIQDDYISFED